MERSDTCLFCQIIAGTLESAIIWQDDQFIAFLDINPTMTGQVVLVSKKHYDSDLSDMPDVIYEKFFLAAREVSTLLKKALDVKRVALVVEGMGVNHAHIKLYPLPGLSASFQEMWGKERVFFKTYEGYITTQLGPTVDITMLKKLAQHIASFMN